MGFMVGDGSRKSEEEYVHYLEAERSRYAWVMRVYGYLSQAQATEAAERRYPYEHADAPYRGLIFHDEAWHWAMLDLKGERYWLRHPELTSPPDSYNALD
ncbi:hypothetical protein [Frankia sp. CcI49]|uniref:hypothetical protein n=1 Tax=Frankia sp. CcI49 TaxID=1745382 RepID=UPI0018E92945|nr:hypothetical protein [Frankia sp. CcI49]